MQRVDTGYEFCKTDVLIGVRNLSIIILIFRNTFLFIDALNAIILNIVINIVILSMPFDEFSDLMGYTEDELLVTKNTAPNRPKTIVEHILGILLALPKYSSVIHILLLGFS